MGGTNAKIRLPDDLVAGETPVSSNDFTVDGGVLVGTGNGTYQEESGATLRTSIGLDGNSNTTHYHDSRYYTETESDARYLLESNNLSDLTSPSDARTNLGLSGEVSTHTHDDMYYTESEVDSLLYNQPATYLDNTDDLDSLSDGWYSWTSSTPSNAPDNYMIMVQVDDGSQKIQIAYGTATSGKIYVRRADSGTFYTWTEFATENWVTNNFNNYTHPTFNGDDFSVDSGALTGATVISDIDINVTTNSEGHVTDANGSISTRNMTAGNLSLGSSDDVTFASVTTTGNVNVGSVLYVDSDAVFYDNVHLRDPVGGGTASPDLIFEDGDDNEIGRIYSDAGVMRFRSDSTMRIQDVDLTTDNEHDVSFFGDGSTGQANAYYNKVKIFGGSSQSRHLELYQENSGNATVEASWGTLDLIANGNWGNITLDTVGDITLDADTEINLTAGSTYINVNSPLDFGSDSGARTILRLEDTNVIRQISDRGGMAFTAADDAAIYGGGDFAKTYENNISPESEQVYIVSDNNVYIHTDLQTSGYSGRYEWVFADDGALECPGDIEIQSKFAIVYNSTSESLDFNYIG